MATPRDKDRPLWEGPSPEAGPRVCVIAEIGVNHDGDPATALRLVDDAAAAGADAVKVQLFHPQRLLSEQALLASYQQNAATDAKELLAGLAMGVEQLQPVADHARELGLRFIATPFSPGDIDDLRALEVDAVKIASPDAVNPPLLEAAATLGKPLLVSTGTCALGELDHAAALIKRMNAISPTSTYNRSALLHCVSCYPTPRERASLGAVRVMREALGVPVGYSDHTTALDTGGLAAAAGAVVLEKHLTHDKTALGPDHAASLTRDELRVYVENVRDAEQALGPAAKQPLDIEGDVRHVSRQSVCVTLDLPAGHVITASDVTVKRPGTGVPAAQMRHIIGQKLTRPVAANNLLQPLDIAEDTAQH